jgi:hypothetical protein
VLFLNLEAPEHERSQEAMDLRDDFLLLLLIIPLLIGECKKLGELIRRLEQFRHQEVEERPQFLDFILQGRTSQQNSVPCIELPEIL